MVGVEMEEGRMNRANAVLGFARRKQQDLEVLLCFNFLSRCCVVFAFRYDACPIGG